MSGYGILFLPKENRYLQRRETTLYEHSDSIFSRCYFPLCKNLKPIEETRRYRFNKFFKIFKDGLFFRNSYETFHLSLF